MSSEELRLSWEVRRGPRKGAHVVHSFSRRDLAGSIENKILRRYKNRDRAELRWGEDVIGEVGPIWEGGMWTYWYDFEAIVAWLNSPQEVRHV